MKGSKSKKALIVLMAVIMVLAFGIQCYATEGTDGEEGTQTAGSKVTIERKIETTNGSVSFILTGVNFEEGKEYEYTLSKTKGVPENARFIGISMDYNKKQVMITVTDESYFTTDKEKEFLIRKTNTAYLFVREKGTENYILEKEMLNLELPLDSVTSVKVADNSDYSHSLGVMEDEASRYDGGLFIGKDEENLLYNFSRKDVSYVFKKIDDTKIITEYSEDKNSEKILSSIKSKDIPDKGWKSLDDTYYIFRNDFWGFDRANIYKRSLPTDKGLYVLYLKFYKDGNKVVYAAPYVYDNLGANSDPGTETELTATVSYNPTETTTGTVTATIKTNKKVNKVEGWNISDDGKTLTKTYSKNQTETVTLEDEDGKKKNVDVKVSNITIKIAEDDGKDEGKDETVAPGKKLPQTGESYVVLAVAGVVVLAGVVGVVRYRKYKGI